MQFSLKNGDTEAQRVIFKDQDVRNYCEMIGYEYDSVVPTLMCAQLWPEFKVFQSFSNEEIMLVRTKVEKYENLESDMQYCAYLTYKKSYKVKRFDQFIFELKINNNNKTCIIIEQTFIKEVKMYDI
ncbi:protein VraC [Staphylococcus devriesei]|uniref:protein VraC n=1 Tax=Staphylococcus devriesei TaxID=586733 RepID=UPI000E6A2A76|nr:protein VraC [Staphylococcus devriesei]RIL71383.1 protein VraC [Staphylococcus devriesei]